MHIALNLHVNWFMFNSQILRVGIDNAYIFATERCILVHRLEYFLQKCPKSSQTILAPRTIFSALLWDFVKYLNFGHFLFFIT